MSEEQPPRPAERKDVPPPGEPVADPERRKLSLDESQAFQSRTLEEQAREAEHSRRERFRDHLANGALILLWGMVGAAMVGLLIGAWHLLAPESWGWLSKEQLGSLRTIFTSGVIVGGASEYIRRNLQ